MTKQPKATIDSSSPPASETGDAGGRDIPAITEVAPGILQVRLPLPFALDHVNVWLLADHDAAGRDGWTLIDTGVSSERMKRIWNRIVTGPLGGKPVLRLLVTHFHPDHIGLADWLCERFSVPLLMSQAEWLLARLLSQDTSDAMHAAYAEFYSAMGLPPEMSSALSQRSDSFHRGVPRVPAQYHRQRMGSRLRIGDRQWEVITSGGHSPEHVCLFSPADDILLAGDMVLPRISPNVSVWPAEPDADPLAEFLAGLAQLRHLPATTLVLPSHGAPFRGLHQRIDALTGHHADRLAETLQFCRSEPQTAAAVTGMLFRRELDVHQMSFAAGEALAHLNHLLMSGHLIRQGRPDGVWLYATV